MMKNLVDRFCILSAILLWSSLPVFAETANWGMAATQCGNNQFYITVGGGSDIYLTRINGIVTGSSTVQDTTTERQVLMSVAGNASVNGMVVSNPTPLGYEHEVNRGVYVIDLKQVGTAPVHVPFNVHFAVPVLVPGGALAANMFVATYDPAGNELSGPCLQSEAHLELVWQTSSSR